jgi:recombination protein RecA
MAPKKKVLKKTGESVEDTLKAIKAKFGEDSVMMLDQAAMDVEAIQTGSFGLDLALGIGGFPKGRIIEISGPESSGKTTLALHCIAEAQKIGGICAFIDAEHALDPEYAKKIGVKTAELLISQPDYGEQALDMVETMVQSGKFAVIVIDSVASLTPKSEIEGEMGAANVGRHAKLMSQACRKLAPLVNHSNVVLIFINQIRMNINVLPGMPIEFTTGGKALKFYSSVRLDIRRIGQIKKKTMDGDEVVGGRTRIKVIKNKVAAPHRQTEFDIMYGEGISREGELLALGEKWGIISKSGNSYQYNKETIGVGYDKTRCFLKDNPMIADIVQKEIEDAIHLDKQTYIPSEMEEMENESEL